MDKKQFLMYYSNRNTIPTKVDIFSGGYIFGGTEGQTNTKAMTDTRIPYGVPVKITIEFRTIDMGDTTLAKITAGTGFTATNSSVTSPKTFTGTLTENSTTTLATFACYYNNYDSKNGNITITFNFTNKTITVSGDNKGYANMYLYLDKVTVEKI